MRSHANTAIATKLCMALSAHMRMRRRTRTEDSAQVHQTLFLLLGVGSGDETNNKQAQYTEPVFITPRACARGKVIGRVVVVVVK